MHTRIVTFATLAATMSCFALRVSAASYSDAVLADNPVAYYRLNETTGTVAQNSSAYGALLDGMYIGYGEAPEGSGPIHIGQAGPRPGDPTGAATIVGMEADNRAIHSAINFPDPPTEPPTTGENPRVEVPEIDSNPLDITGALTLEAWIYRDPQTPGYNSNNEGIVAKYSGGGSQRGYELVHQANNGGIRFILSRFGVYEGAFDLGSPADALPLQEWAHVAATYVPSTRMAIFVNGALVAEQTNPANIPAFIFDSSAPLWIGTQLGTGNALTAFEGRIDEVAVYDTALSDERILAHYQAAASNAPPVLAGDYNNNGVVDAADYAVWRKHAGTSNPLPNDPLGGMIGSSQYDQWQANFGATLGSGTAAFAVIPEPRGLLLLLFGMVATLSATARSRQARATLVVSFAPRRLPINLLR